MSIRDEQKGDKDLAEYHDTYPYVETTGHNIFSIFAILAVGWVGAWAYHNWWAEKPKTEYVDRVTTVEKCPAETALYTAEPGESINFSAPAQSGQYIIKLTVK